MCDWPTPSRNFIDTAVPAGIDFNWPRPRGLVSSAVLVSSRRSDHVMSETVASRSSKIGFDPISQRSLAEPPVAILHELSNWAANICPIFFVNSLS